MMRRRRVELAVTMGLLVTLGVTCLPGSAEGQTWISRKGNGGNLVPATMGAVTVRYDPGTPVDVTFFPGPLVIVGNRFDSRSGSPLISGTVTAIQAYWGGSDATYPVLAAFNTAQTVIFGVTYGPGQMPFQFNTFAVSWPVPPMFLAGVLASSNYASSADSVGLRYSSTGGQGFHAVAAVNSFGGPVNTIAGANAMVRISGDVVVPVELMEFDIE